MTRRARRPAERKRRAELKELRAEWRAWKRAAFWQDLSHIDYCLAPCADRCGTCEGCASAAYRADHLADIERRAAELDVEALPQRKREAEPGQLTFDLVEVAPGVYEG